MHSSHNVTTEQVLEDARAIAAAQSEVSIEGALLWRDLGRRHYALLEKHGFENFKRTINFEYGQSSVSTPHHPYIRRLLKNLLRSGTVPFGILAGADFSDADHIEWPVITDTVASRHPGQNARRLICYAAYCGLLWQFARRVDRLNCLALSEPTLGRPMPVVWSGRLISQDLALAAIDLNRISQFVQLGKVRRILEVGAGYGRLAYLIRSLFPQIQYCIVDISPTLAVSQNYLEAVFGADDVMRFQKDPALSKPLNFLLPHQLSSLPDNHFDLVVNMSSFDEMPSDTSIGYLKEIDRLCSGHLYLNGFPQTSKRGNSRLGLDELPYDTAWKLLFSGPHPVHVHFVEKIFDLRS